MKKALIALVSVLLILMLVVICACSYVPSTSFLSRTKVNSLVDTYGTPQAVVTITYSRSDNGTSKERVVTVTYDLLLSQTPIAVIRFIQLAEAGVYNNTIIDTLASNKKHMVMGRYAAIKNDDNSYTYFNRSSDVTFAGEFKSNGYNEPQDGYAQFSTFSLAMYHDDTKDDSSFNAANGTLILALSDTPFNSNNYAVFAKLSSLSYTLDGKQQGSENRKEVPGNIIDDLASFSSTTSSTKVYDDEEQTTYTEPRILSTKVIIHVEIKGAPNKSADWSQLPRIGK